eukprot:11195154-Lingulodinium_polyedra.AAC.1
MMRSPSSSYMRALAPRHRKGLTNYCWAAFVRVVRPPLAAVSRATSPAFDIAGHHSRPGVRTHLVVST